MEICVTGAEGFIGSSIVNFIHQENEVTAIDFLRRNHAVNIHKSVNFVNADLSRNSLDGLLDDDVDLVYHMAIVNIVEVDRDPRLERKNIDMALNILEYARQHDCSLVMGSSASVYGSGINLKEDSPLKPLCLYAAGKVCVEKYASMYSDLYGIDIQILRSAMFMATEPSWMEKSTNQSEA